MDYSLIIAVIALLVSISVIYLNYYRTFDLVVRVIENIPWTDKDKFFRLDLWITFVNMGNMPGWIEALTVYIDNYGKEIQMKPDYYYRLSGEGKPVLKEWYRPFLLSPKRDLGRLVGFRGDVPIDALQNGSVNAVLTVIYKKDPRKEKGKNLNIKIPLIIEKKAALMEGKTRIPNKKAATVFPFNWEIFSGLFPQKKD